ncbi:DUF4321 domain-containing protein [Heliorestis acidaminivorans]|uniref:DUF4321 domain-containing protein n=1 Tax=Heliorestis acidaminivorans TaxID=553427 RepID=A0A6I0ERR6_9FIRM|nr:DUF4321 domain-containing protein [Heliorestis acidaminivorans]KAB2952343.1 DUF4321 domain-containing protein [Heliorestis acidaminivorans]
MRTFRGGGSRRVGILIVLLIAGAIIGSLIGEALRPVLPFLVMSKDLALSPTRIDLVALNFTFGFTIKLNVAGALGMIGGYFLYRHL